MALARLTLYPQQPDHRPQSVAALVDALKHTGLLAAETSDHCYLPGEQFLNLFSFLGCSPQIHLHPDEGDNYCYIRIDDTHENAVCLGYTTTVIPRCPGCKHKLRDWKQVGNWQQAATACRCEHCKTETAMSQLKWRHECAYGRFSLYIAHIHPHEAVPTEQLLIQLRQASGFEWDYCYANN